MLPLPLVSFPLPLGQGLHAWEGRPGTHEGRGNLLPSSHPTPGWKAKWFSQGVPGMPDLKEGARFCPQSNASLVSWAADPSELWQQKKKREITGQDSKQLCVSGISQPRGPMVSVFPVFSCLPRRLAQLLELGLSSHTSPVLGLALSERGDVSHELDLPAAGWALRWEPAALWDGHRSKQGTRCSARCWWSCC